jgi:hypothetical protein
MVENKKLPRFDDMMRKLDSKLKELNPGRRDEDGGVYQVVDC